MTTAEQTFEKDFPDLNKHVPLLIHNGEYWHNIHIAECCLSKQKVRKEIEKICTEEWENCGKRLKERLGL